MWQPFNLDFNGPTLSESGVEPNPFLDYRLQVTFSRPDGTQLTVPGFFDGDGTGGGPMTDRLVELYRDAIAADVAARQARGGPE